MIYKYRNYENFEIKHAKTDEDCRKKCSDSCFKLNIRGHSFSHKSFDKYNDTFCSCLC